MKIVVAERISSSAIETLRSEPRWKVVTPEDIHEDLLSQIETADALIVRSAVQVDAAMLERARKLRVIGRAGIGVDNVDLETATRRGIAVMNTPGANATAVAEHTLALMLAMARHIPRAHELTRTGKWEKKKLQGSELRGKVLGIVGLGRIGLEVARHAKTFGMQILAHDPFVTARVAEEAGVRLVTLDELFRRSDYISLHLALTAQTAGMINAQTIAKMKKGVRLVNCARGELIDESALADALGQGHVSGAALDVFTQEPPRDSPLLKLENVIVTPHIAGSTHEAQEAVGVQIAIQVKEFLKRGVIQNAVNVPSVSHDEYVAMQPYIELAESLAAFLAQTTDGNLQEISLRYSGTIADWRTELVRNAAVKGVLNQMLAEKANLVNAGSLAAERGIAVREIRKPKTPGGAAGNVLSLMLHTSIGAHLVKGTVLHGKEPRLLAIDDIDVEAPLERNLIYLRNRDVPGVIGRIGTVLGNNSINIANFSLGRRRERDQQRVREAIAVVHVDSRVPESVLEELRKIPAVLVAKAIRL
jgi:D-3-phosphoglycerate dehydrogenase